MIEAKLLYNPTDCHTAYFGWGANCGPMSLAALLSREVNDVRDLFTDFIRLKYTNPTQMEKALQKVGATKTNTPSRGVGVVGCQLPNFGLAFLQWTGGWWDSKPIAVQYRHTHWIASQKVDCVHWVYDCNSEIGWITRQEWLESMLPRFKDELKCKGCYIRTGFEVCLAKGGRD